MIGSAACNAKAMGLVSIQIALSVALGLAARGRPDLRAVLSSGWSLAGSFLLMMVGVLAIRSCPLAAWLSFTVGAALLVSPVTSGTNALRGLLTAVGLLVVAAALAPFVNYYGDAGGILSFGLLALLTLLLLQLFFPAKRLSDVASSFGAALFAVWTVYDVATVPCDDPLQKSLSVFLDLLNLYTFSRG
jgi:FtsH-binding integral membrane protein